VLLIIASMTRSLSLPNGDRAGASPTKFRGAWRELNLSGPMPTAYTGTPSFSATSLIAYSPTSAISASNANPQRIASMSRKCASQFAVKMFSTSSRASRQ
jgi:hypothetical protein